MKLELNSVCSSRHKQNSTVTVKRTIISTQTLARPQLYRFQPVFEEVNYKLYDVIASLIS